MAEGDWAETARPAGAISRGPLPPLRPGVRRVIRVGDPAHYLAQSPMIEAAEEAAYQIQLLARDPGFDGFASNVLDREAESLIVYWKGPLPQEMEELVAELRREVAIDVRHAAYSEEELLQESRRIIELALPGIRITSVGPMRDCSGLRVTVDEGNDLARAAREIESHMRLEFGVQRPAMLAGGAATLRSDERPPYLPPRSPNPISTG